MCPQSHPSRCPLRATSLPRAPNPSPFLYMSPRERCGRGVRGRVALHGASFHAARVPGASSLLLRESSASFSVAEWRSAAWRRHALSQRHPPQDPGLAPRLGRSEPSRGLPGTARAAGARAWERSPWACVCTFGVEMPSRVQSGCAVVCFRSFFERDTSAEAGTRRPGWPSRQGRPPPRPFQPLNLCAAAAATDKCVLAHLFHSVELDSGPRALWPQRPGLPWESSV